MKIGYVGLGRMGRNMVLRLLEQGIEVVAFNRSPEPLQEVVKAGASGASSLDDLVSKLRSASSLRDHKVAKQSPGSNSEIATGPSDPRNDNIIVWLMLPAGEVTDRFIDQLIPLLTKGDLLIDGANSFYKDTLRRAEKLAAKNIHFMDIGVSGGPKGAREGSCLMIGGSDEDFLRVEPLSKAAAAPGAYQHLGPAGAGHFAKMVHNGIEYGMMESIGEGLAVLKASPFKYDFVKLLDLYNHRSVIESRLIGWTLAAFEEDADLSNISSAIGSGGSGKRIPGEADWTVEVAKEEAADTPAIESAIKVRTESEKDKEDSSNGFRNEQALSSANAFRNKVISAMRGQFGQHDVKKKN